MSEIKTVCDVFLVVDFHAVYLSINNILLFVVRRPMVKVFCKFVEAGRLAANFESKTCWLWSELLRFCPVVVESCRFHTCVTFSVNLFSADLSLNVMPVQILMKCTDSSGGSSI